MQTSTQQPAKEQQAQIEIVIEAESSKNYRMFTDEEIEQWKKDDILPPELAKETEDYLKKLGMP